jgi:pimeloyl-ACP methyl ester carboxylesterase
LYPLGELIADEARVHLIDLPGFGRSEAPAEVWGKEEYAKCIVEYLDRQGIEKADFLGHSFGGKVAMSVAARYPARVRGLVLVNSSGLKRRRTGKEQARYAFVRSLRSILRTVDKVFRTKYYTEFFIPRFASADYKSAGPLRALLVRSVNEDLTEEARQITAPSLLIWGTKDTETPIELGRRLHHLIRNSTLTELPGVGHNPFDWAGFHLLATLVLPFLRLLNGPDRPRQPAAGAER